MIIYHSDLLNHLNAESNPIYHLLALLGAHHILHVGRIRVKIGNMSIKFVEKIKKAFNNPPFFFFFENRAFYEIMWENIVERDRPQMKIWRMRIA